MSTAKRQKVESSATSPGAAAVVAEAPTDATAAEGRGVDKDPITTEPDNDFRCGHRFGNFSNYYNFHSCEERLNEIPLEIFHNLIKRKETLSTTGTSKSNIIYILDVGCNEGDLSVGLLLQLRTVLPTADCRLLAVDLDPSLIASARKKYADVTGATFECIDVMSEDFEILKNEILKGQDLQSFDIVSCFSTTMWIHLNFGDEGLKSFLTKLGNCSSSVLIIEPQKWKSYKTAVERCRRKQMDKFTQYSALTWRGAEIDDHIARYVSSAFPLELYRKSACGEEIVASDLLFWGRSMLIFCSPLIIVTEEEGKDNNSNNVV
jgi:SAM-dependent methyltransferase